MQTLEKIIMSDVAPATSGAMWLDTSDIENPRLKISISGEWKPLSVDFVLPTASATELGGIKVGDNLSINSAGKLSGTAPYSLPTASAETLGGIKVGSGLSINENGVLSASGGGGASAIVVEGTIDDASYAFTPNEGEISLADAISAFDNGTPIVLKFTIEGAPLVITAKVCWHFYAGADNFLGGVYTEDDRYLHQIFWAS